MAGTFSALEIAHAYDQSRWLRRYVCRKIAGDPIFETAWKFISLRRQPVWDLGCGIGLLGISMRSGGLTERYRGFDTVAWKVNLAKEAMRHFGFENIGFEVRDVLSVEIPTGATVCLIDVLHSLPEEEQSQMLDRLANAAASGSLVLLRTIFKEDGFRYIAALLSEFLPHADGWTCGSALNFPHRSQLVGFFQSRGLRVGVIPVRSSPLCGGELVLVEKTDV